VAADENSGIEKVVVCIACVTILRKDAGTVRSKVRCRHVWGWLEMRREPQSVDVVDVYSVSLTAVTAIVMKS
jgi:hypothetical protein